MNKKIILPLLVSLLISACSTSSKVSSSVNENILSESLIIKSPNEDNGLEGGHSDDQVASSDTSILKKLMTRVSLIDSYSYHIKVNFQGVSEEFTDYYTPNAFYEEYSDHSKSFGYAQTKNEKHMFKYYLSEDGREVYPSIYEYEGYDNSKVVGLYSPMTLAHFSMLEATLDTFDSLAVSTNKFLVTDTDSASIFQYMTTYGSAIINYMSSVYIDIINIEENTFKCTIDLASLGSIEAYYTPLEETKIDHVNDLIELGRLEGVDYYDDVHTFLNQMVKSDNFIMEGITQEGDVTLNDSSPYTIYCNKNYFYFTYNKEMFPNYSDFGYVFVPKNTEITYRKYDNEGNYSLVSQCLAYDACYGFSFIDNNFVFDEFIGPVENENMRYLEVEELPSEGEGGILYICPNEEGVKMVYEWAVINIDENGNYIYDFVEYSSWYDSIGDFYFTNVTATFYLSGTSLCDVGSIFFEKDLNSENTYYSKDSGVMSQIANSIFKVGFQDSDTWMDYVTQANIKIHKDENGQITSGDVGLSLLASKNQGEVKEHKIYYTIKDFGQGYVSNVDQFLEGIIGA